MSQIIANSITLVLTVKEAQGVFDALDERPADPKGEILRPGQNAPGHLAEQLARQPKSPTEDKVVWEVQAADVDELANRLAKSHPALSKTLREYRKGDVPATAPTGWAEL